MVLNYLYAWILIDLYLLFPFIPILFIIILSFIFKKRRTYKNLFPNDEKKGKMEEINNSFFRDLLISVEITIIIGFAVLITQNSWVAVYLGLIAIILVEIGNLVLRIKLRDSGVQLENNPTIEKANKEIGKNAIIFGIIVLIIAIVIPLIFMAMAFIGITHTIG